MNTLTDDLREAFNHAEKHRRAAGFGTRSISEMKTTRSDGTVWIGPKTYKWTGYFMPWDYLDIIRGIEHSDRPDQSMTKFIKTAVKEKCDRLLKESQHSARPEPRKAKEEKGAAVVPIRRPRTTIIEEKPAEKRSATG